MEPDARTWQGGMEADDRASYGVGGQSNWVGPTATAGDLNKQGYYQHQQHQQHQAYGIEAPESRPGYYGEHGPPLGGADMATSCEPAVYGSGAQVVPIGPTAGGVYEALPPPPPPPHHHHHHHQHHQHFPSADMEHWHLQMLSQTDPFLALPMRDAPAKRKRRRVISVEQRKAANIRERRRMYQLNEAFDGLRKRVPTFAYEKKLSRIETLKLAVTYIEFMTDLLDNNGEKCKKLLEKAKAKREHNNNNSQNGDDDATKTLITEDDSLTSVSDNDCASLSQSPNQSAEGKRSRDMSEDELCDS